MGTVEQNGMPQ
jgi:hypothetical protein